MSHRPLSTPLKSHEILLALLPGLAIVAVKSGTIQYLGDSWFLSNVYYAVFPLCLALVIVSLVHERRLTTWSFPAIGVLLSASLSILLGATSMVAQSFPSSYPTTPFIYSVAVWGTLVALAIYYHLPTIAPRWVWMLLAAVIGIDFLRGAVNISTLSNLPTLPQLIFTALPETFLIGFCLLPVLIPWRLEGQSGMKAVLVVLAAEFYFVDAFYDPGYAIGMWTKDPNIARWVDTLPALGFLIISPLWFLTARSFRWRAIGLLLPSSLSLAIAELVSGSLRSYYTPAQWLQRGMGGSEFMLIVALALVLYAKHRDQPTELLPLPTTPVSST